MERAVHILRALFREVLSNCGREAPTLTDIVIERARERFQPRLGAQFSNGHCAWTVVRASDFYDFCEGRSAWDLETLRRALLREAHQIYGQMLSDYLAEVGLRERRERLRQLQPMPCGTALTEQIRCDPHQIEQVIQRYVDEIQGWTDAHRRDAPPRRRSWLLQRWSQSSRSAISLWASFAGKKAALARADRLLKENLSGAQKEQLKKGGYFEVTGGRTGKRYRIRRGSQMNIEELDENGRRNYVLCFMPEGHLADGDVMLAQKVALELFEFEALKIANRIPRYVPRFDQSQGARARTR